MNTHWFKGSDWENDFCTAFAPGVTEACDVYHTMETLETMDEGILDMVEICGGVARTKLVPLLLGVDLGQEQTLTW
jgi:hypothetical protein